jgi:peptidoglycan/xylan/chitin deacetylase (PgdA/CDA1 family)
MLPQNNLIGLGIRSACYLLGLLWVCSAWLLSWEWSQWSFVTDPPKLEEGRGTFYFGLALGSGLSFGLTLFLSIWHPPWNLFRPYLLSKKPFCDNGIFLTFDDGPHPLHTSLVLDLLKEHGAKATFFVVGERAREHPHLIRRILEEGHSLGNHTHRHKWWFPFALNHQIQKELWDCQNALSLAGAGQCLWFRPPFGVAHPRMVGVAQRLGLNCVLWTFSFRDGVHRKNLHAQKELQKALPHLRPGGILVMHDVVTGPLRPQCLDFLKELLGEIHSRDLRALPLPHHSPVDTPT